MANMPSFADDFIYIQKVTLSCVLVRLFLWPLLIELLHENGIHPQPDPIEGIGNLTLVGVAYLAAVSAADPMVGVSRKSPSLIWPGGNIFFILEY